MTGFDFLHVVDLHVVDEARTPARSAEVYIEVGAWPAQVAPVRVVAADLAARADFDLDAVSDLRMAVDEACSTLATLAPPGARLRCRFEVDLDRITVTARITGPGAAMISRDTFGWRVLNTLTDKVEVLDEDETEASSLGIRLIKERRTGAA